MLNKLPCLAARPTGRPAAGDVAPPLDATDLDGHRVSLAGLRGGPVLVAFFRYASCPLCNLRVHELRRAWPRLQARGLRIVAVFQSPAEVMRRHVARHATEFPFVADPGLQLYRAWGVERSWLGLAGSGLFGAGQLARAFVRGFLPGRVDGPVDRMPADFLVGADGRLREAFYARHAGEHLPLARLFELLDAPSSHAGEK